MDDAAGPRNALDAVLHAARGNRQEVRAAVNKFLKTADFDRAEALLWRLWDADRSEAAVRPKGGYLRAFRWVAGRGYCCEDLLGGLMPLGEVARPFVDALRRSPGYRGHVIYRDLQLGDRVMARTTYEARAAALAEQAAARRAAEDREAEEREAAHALREAIRIGDRARVAALVAAAPPEVYLNERDGMSPISLALYVAGPAIARAMFEKIAARPETTFRWWQLEVLLQRLWEDSIARPPGAQENLGLFRAMVDSPCGPKLTLGGVLFRMLAAPDPAAVLPPFIEALVLAPSFCGLIARREGRVWIEEPCRDYAARLGKASLVPALSAPRGAWMGAVARAAQGAGRRGAPPAGEDPGGARA